MTGLAVPTVAILSVLLALAIGGCSITFIHSFALNASL